MYWLKWSIVSFFIVAISSVAAAATYPLPKKGNDIVGKIQTAVVKEGQSFSDIARQYDVGYYQLIEANPGVDQKAPQPDTVLIIPTEYVLPQVVRKGMVVNLAELRLYYFPKGKDVVITYPLGIGRQGWNTPLGLHKIVQKVKNPTWYVPKSIREWREEQGVDLPKSVPPGPDNPLGKYMMRLSAWTYLIHGTNQPKGVGRRTSSGCLRMFPEDIKQLFAQTPMDTRVYIINTPFKAGWENNKLYIESHLPLQEMQEKYDDDFEPLIKTAVNKAIKSKNAKVKWQKVENIASEEQGLPQQIGYLSRG